MSNKIDLTAIDFSSLAIKLAVMVILVVCGAAYLYFYQSGLPRPPSQESLKLEIQGLNQEIALLRAEEPVGPIDRTYLLFSAVIGHHGCSNSILESTEGKNFYKGALKSWSGTFTCKNFVDSRTIVNLVSDLPIMFYGFELTNEGQMKIDYSVIGGSI